MNMRSMIFSFMPVIVMGLVPHFTRADDIHGNSLVEEGEKQVSGDLVTRVRELSLEVSPDGSNGPAPANEAAEALAELNDELSVDGLSREAPPATKTSLAEQEGTPDETKDKEKEKTAASPQTATAKAAGEEKKKKEEEDDENKMVFGVFKAKTLEKVMGPLGGSLAILMFLSAGPVVLQIIREGTVGGFSVFPYVVQMCNCALWVIYSTSDVGSPFGGKGTMLWPFICNAVGVVIATGAYTVYFTYSTSEERRPVMMWSWPSYLLILGFAVYVFMQEKGEKRQLAAEIAGWCCLVINIIMYLGPLAGIKTAVSTRSTRYLPLSLGVTTLGCSAIWFLFGIGIANYKIWFPNACGIVFGLIQISVFIYLTYVVGTKDDVDGTYHVSMLDEPTLQHRQTYGNFADTFNYRNSRS